MLNLKQFLEQNNNLDDKVKENQGESSADKSKKPNQATQTADKATAKTDQDKAKDSVEKQKMQMRQNRAKVERAKAQARSSQQVAKQVAGGGIRRERTSSADDSIKATGKAGMNMGKSLVKTARTVASVPLAIRARNKKAKVGRVMKGITGEPTGGTKTQIARDAISKGIGNVRRRIEVSQRRSTPVSQRIAQNNSSTSKPTPKPTTSTTPPLKDRMAAGYDKNKSRILRKEDFIHEAEKGKKEIKKEKIDVMKGTNKIEVNPKSLPEAKKMTKRQIKKRDEIADAISTKEMNQRYGDKNVKYAIATKLAMKKKKKIDEAKIDTVDPKNKRARRNEIQMGKKDAPFRSLSKARVSKLNQEYRQERHKERRGVKKVKGEMTLKDRVGEMRGMDRPNRLARIAQHAKKIDVTDVKKYKDGSSGGTISYSHYEPEGPVVMEAKEESGYISNLAKAQVRNQRKFGKKGSTEPQGFFGQQPSEVTELSKKRTDEHKAKRGVKNESVSGIEVQNVSDGIKFREYEFIDVVKPEPMRSPKNNITWTEGRDEYGDQVGGPKISKKELKKNLISNTPDEQHTTTTSEETVNEIYGKTADKASKSAARKYQYADNNLTRERAYRQQKKFSNYATKKLRKLHQDREDFEKIYKKPDAVKEAKAPVGLMKLAATVAANKKKRKNALQIQKYIGEGIDSESKKSPDTTSGTDLIRTAHLSGRFTRFPAGEETKKATERKRLKREKIANEETIVEKSNTGPNNPKSDTRINYRTSFTQDRVLNSTPEEERGAAKRKSTAEMIRQKKRDEIDKKKAEFKKKRKSLMAKGEIKSPDSK